MKSVILHGVLFRLLLFLVVYQQKKNLSLKKAEVLSEVPPEMDGNRGFSNYCKRSLNSSLCSVRISSFYRELYTCRDFCRSEKPLEPWRVKHEREHDAVSYGIHDYATKCKPKHTNSLSSLVKVVYHQEGIEVPFFRIFLGSYTLGNIRLSDKCQHLTDKLEQGDSLCVYSVVLGGASLIVLTA